jgi:glutathione S-transferase
MRGAASALRYLLAYCQVPYKERLYSTVDDWLKDKQGLGFDFPNLPYIIDGDKKIAESAALMQYVAIKA